MGRTTTSTFFSQTWWKARFAFRETLQSEKSPARNHEDVNVAAFGLFHGP